MVVLLLRTLLPPATELAKPPNYNTFSQVELSFVTKISSHSHGLLINKRVLNVVVTDMPAKNNESPELVVA